jgi:hypothetical protein
MAYRVLLPRQSCGLLSARAGTEIRNPSGTTQALRAGESGKCCSPPVKKPRPTESRAPSSRVRNKLDDCSCAVSLSRCSMAAPSTKRTMPAAAVHSERSPLKKPWLTAPEMKLMPLYLSSIAAWWC